MIITPSKVTADSMREELLSSLSIFTKFFFEEVTHQEFIKADNRQNGMSAFDTLMSALTRMFKGELVKGIINTPPRIGKTTNCAMFFAWYFAHAPTSRHMYSTANEELGETLIHLVRSIMSHPIYKALFGDYIAKRKNIKTGFFTRWDGELFSYGIGGAFIGRGAGIKGMEDKPSGVHIMDDWNKGQDIYHPAINRKIHRVYDDSVRTRKNNFMVPEVYIGQRMHLQDISGYLLSLKNEKWEHIIVSALDENDNSIDERSYPAEGLKAIRASNDFVFYCQYQQKVEEASKKLFKREWFISLNENPEFIKLFIVIDTGESDKIRACDTVMSLFGVYKIENFFGKTDRPPYGLHWIDALTIKAKPAFLLEELEGFFSKACLIHGQIPPIYIEKKSTGVMLLSILEEHYRGIEVYPINRNKMSKLQRFSLAAPFVRRRLVSYPLNGDHVEKCLDQVCNIGTTVLGNEMNDTVDTLADAISLLYRNETFIENNKYEDVALFAKTAKNIKSRKAIAAIKTYNI